MFCLKRERESQNTNECNSRYAIKPEECHGPISSGIWLGFSSGEVGRWSSDQCMATRLGEAWGLLAFLSPPPGQALGAAFGFHYGLGPVIPDAWDSISVLPFCQKAAAKDTGLPLILRESKRHGQQALLPLQPWVDQGADPSVLLKLRYVFWCHYGSALCIWLW